MLLSMMTVAQTITQVLDNIYLTVRLVQEICPMPKSKLVINECTAPD